MSDKIRPSVGIMGGSGLYDIPGLEVVGERRVDTPYGEPSAPYTLAMAQGGIAVAFLPRHGRDHSIAPHAINYRANIWGFHSLGVRRIIGVSATGGITPDLRPGDIVLADQVLDFTQGARIGTFYDRGRVVHVDFTEPYCPALRRVLRDAGAACCIETVGTGTYVCVNGPRLESRAEIEHFSAIGADLVGMTGMPEAALARELALCMASLCIVTNPAAGLTGRKLTTQEVIETMRDSMDRIREILKAALPMLRADRDCACKDALEGSGM